MKYGCGEALRNKLISFLEEIQEEKRKFTAGLNVWRNEFPTEPIRLVDWKVHNVKSEMYGSLSLNHTELPLYAYAESISLWVTYGGRKVTRGITQKSKEHAKEWQSLQKDF